MWTLKWTLKTSPNYLNPGIHTVFPLASDDWFLFWHVAVRRKMCSHDMGIDWSCLMIVASSSQCSLTDVRDAASSAALVFHITFCCLNIPPSDRAVLVKSVRNGDHCAKYLLDFSEKPLGYPSSLKCCQCLHQIEEAWISDSMMIYNTFLLTREAPQIEIIKHSAELGQTSNNRGREKARQWHHLKRGLGTCPMPET